MYVPTLTEEVEAHSPPMYSLLSSASEPLFEVAIALGLLCLSFGSMLAVLTGAHLRSGTMNSLGERSANWERNGAD